MRRGAWLLMLATAAMACRSSGPSSESNTNWLGPCESTAECEGDGACICGLCTRTCDDDADCVRGTVEATCIAPTTDDEARGCAALVRAAEMQVCLLECSDDSDCRDGMQCSAGGCWARPAGVVDTRDAGGAARADAGPGDAGAKVSGLGAPPPADASTVPRAIDAGTDLTAFDASFDFSDPVEVPEPATAIDATSDAPSLLGVWVWDGGSVVMRLEISEAAGGGGTIGTLTVMHDCPGCLSGPIAPASDPDAGYPVELTVEEQDLLRIGLLGDFPYRVFDGQVSTAEFAFWLSSNDVWRDWCELQTPHPVEVQGRQEYSCSADPIVFDTGGGGTGDAKQQLCAIGHSVCHCTASGCTADSYAGPHAFDLSLGEDVLSGVWSRGGLAVADTQLVAFTRVEEAP